MSDIDIDSMDPASAREYVLSFISTLRGIQKERADLERELDLWEKRAKLAEEKNEPDLKIGAEARVREFKEKIAGLGAEEGGLGRKVSILKEKLKNIKARPNLSIDAEALLAQLKTVTGEEDKLEKELKEEEAEQALKELKKKLKDEEK